MCVVRTGHFNIYYVTQLSLNRQLLQFSSARTAETWLFLSCGGIWGGSLFLLMIRLYVLRTVLLFYLAVISVQACPKLNDHNVAEIAGGWSHPGATSRGLIIVAVTLRSFTWR